ncbi:MAG: hypothetical protein KGI68_10810, partial [Alphaproteobacteria bacterium]|nr:hypothetical protein [Alphaproteobacteria bacterium]MDE2264615.1 hypothetical protein [Alphaproteobacteria bacterium]
EGEFLTEPDKSVRHIVLPLCLQHDGVLWLAEHTTAVGKWVDNCSEDTRDILSERIAEQLETAAENDQKMLLTLSGTWKLPPRGKRSSEGSSDKDVGPGPNA